MSPSAILLDAGGVLVLPDPQPLLQLFGPYGADLETIRRSNYAPTHPAAKHPDRDVWWRHHASTALTCGVPEARLDAVVAELFEIYRAIGHVAAPGAREGLAALRAHGSQLAVVSNHDGTIECTLAKLGLGPFAAVIDSGAVGVAKPDPRIFRLALERLGVDADRAVHVGDHVAVDVAGARAAGIRPIHFDPYDLCATPADHAHIRSLSEAT